MDKILKELYALDPELKKQDKLLRSVLKELIKARPAVSMDPAFYEQLRRQIRLRLKEDGASPWWRGRPWSFAFAGALGLLAVAVVYSLRSSPSGLQIATVEEEAYGPFVASEPGKGGGGDVGEVLDFAFEYVGDPLPEYGSLEAYHYLIPSSNEVEMALDLPNVDMDELGPFYPKRLELAPKNGNGYTLTYESNFGFLSLQEESPYTRARMEACNAGACPEFTYFTEENVPTNAELIAMGESFWEANGLNHELFGQPTVGNFAHSDLGIEPFFVLVYPMILEGKPVYSLWGGVPDGTYMTLDASRQKVTGLDRYPLSTHFEKSLYPTLSSDQILTEAEDGGFGFQHWAEPTRIVTLQLGTPELVLSYYTQWEGDGEQTYYLPTLRFPVLNDTEDLLGTESILVPLVEMTVN